VVTKDDRWNIEIPEDRVDEANLFYFRPDDICHAMEARLTRRWRVGQGSFTYRVDSRDPSQLRHQLSGLSQDVRMVQRVGGWTYRIRLVRCRLLSVAV